MGHKKCLYSGGILLRLRDRIPVPLAGHYLYDICKGSSIISHGFTNLNDVRIKVGGWFCWDGMFGFPVKKKICTPQNTFLFHYFIKLLFHFKTIFFPSSYKYNPVDAGLFFKSFFYIAVIYLKNIIM